MLNATGVKEALNIARDVTVAALNENPSISFVSQPDDVAKFYEVILHKVEELIIKNNSQN